MKHKEENSIIHIPFFSKDECNKCIEYAHQKEKDLKKLNIPDNCKYGENRITTNLHNEYNFFIDNPQYIKRLQNKINFLFKSENYPLFIQSWVNIYRKNDKIDWHQHNITSEIYTAGYTANIFIGGNENIGLTYAIHAKEYPKYYYRHIKNKLGYMMIFPNTMYHMVRKNIFNETRYTIGMTLTLYNQHIAKSYINNELNNTDNCILLLRDYSESKSQHKNNILYQ